MCMGDSGNDAATAKSRDIDRAIKVDEKRMAKEVKLLLLGKLGLQFWFPTTHWLTNCNLKVLEKAASRQFSSK